MKKLLLLSLLALTGAASLRAGRAEYVTRVESCEAILREAMASPETAIPASVLQRAHAIVIVNQFKVGFIFGVKDGYGVILVKQADGRWSVPVLLAAGEFSVGFQVGANNNETIMILTNDATPRILFSRKFAAGVDAKAVAGPRSSEAQTYNREMLENPVLLYNKSHGLFAGATVKAGWLERDDKSNFVLYGTAYTMPELLYANWVTPAPEVVPLMDFVKQIAP